MGWLIRGSHRYFYRCVWINGKPKNIYAGKGLQADLAAQQQKQRNKARLQARQKRQQALAEIAAQRKTSDHISGQIDLLLSGMLIVAGFYRSDRGPWRVRRFTVKEHSECFDSQSSLSELLQGANAGNPSALACLREYLRQRPEIWQNAGDLARQALDARLNRMTEGDVLRAESMRLKLEAMRASIASSNPCELERLAIDGFFLAWFEVHQVAIAAQAGINLTEARELAPLQNGAWRRFVCATRSLAMVQRELPAIKRASQQLLQDESSAPIKEIAGEGTYLAAQAG